MKKIFLTLLALTVFPWTAINGEPNGNLPQWAQEGNLKKDQVIGRGADVNSAMLDALGQIYDQLPHAIDSTSLMAYLHSTDSTLTIDQRSDWAMLVNAHYPIEVTDSASVDSALWLLVSADMEQVQQIHQHLCDSLLSEARVRYLRAHALQEAGDLLSASNELAGTLQMLSVLAHAPIRPDESYPSDLGRDVLHDYLSLYDNLKIEAKRQELPIVANEEIPLDVTFVVKAGNQPVINFPVQVSMDEGLLQAPSATDGKGQVSVHIKQAPTKEGYLRMAPAEDLADLSIYCFGRPLLYKKLKTLASAQTHLVPFNPIPSFALQLDSADMAHHDSIAVILDRAGMTEADSTQKPDLICKVTYQSERSANEKHGDYVLAMTHCALKITVTESLSGKVIVNYGIPQFDFTHPGKRSEASVRQRAMELMVRQVSNDLPKFVQKDCYDKRKAVYDRVK